MELLEINSNLYKISMNIGEKLPFDPRIGKNTWFFTTKHGNSLYVKTSSENHPFSKFLKENGVITTYDDLIHDLDWVKNYILYSHSEMQKPGETEKGLQRAEELGVSIEEIDKAIEDLRFHQEMYSQQVFEKVQQDIVKDLQPYVEYRDSLEAKFPSTQTINIDDILEAQVG